MIRIPKHKIAVVPIDDPDKIGSIWIPEIARERCDQGIVKYTGTDVKDIKLGDYVLFSGYSGTLVHVEGEGRLIIIPEEFVVATLAEPPNVDVPGLYFRGPSGYFLANFEQAMELITKAFTDFGKTLKVKTPRPRVEEYEKLRGG